MSNKRIIETDLAPQAIGPYSQAVASGNFFFVSGQLGFDLRTMELPETFAAQAKNALYNLKAIVESCGSRLDRVLTVTIYLKNMEDYAPLNSIYADFFPAQPPARAVVEVSNLPKGGLIEIANVTGFIEDTM